MYPESVKRNTSPKPEPYSGGSDLTLIRRDVLSQYTLRFHVGNTQISVVLCLQTPFIFYNVKLHVK